MSVWEACEEVGSSAALESTRERGTATEKRCDTPEVDKTHHRYIHAHPRDAKDEYAVV